MIDSVVGQAVLLALRTYALGRVQLELLHINLRGNARITLPQNGERIIESLEARRIFRMKRVLIAVGSSRLHFLAPLLLSS